MEKKGGAGAFGGNHGGAEGRIGGATDAEVGAVGGLHFAEQDLVGGAMRRIGARRGGGRGEFQGGVIGGVFGAQGKSAHGDGAEATPLAVGNFKDDVQDAEGFGITFGMDDAGIGVDHVGLAAFEEAENVEDAEEDVGGFEAGDGDGAADFVREGT